ncbi:MAG: hypothetical protein LBH72_07790 [Proteiniphilum sp.]|jgi:hypothetical protein|nr:hypothetical protein [Proteiniphilum sp.]
MNVFTQISIILAGAVSGVSGDSFTGIFTDIFAAFDWNGLLFVAGSGMILAFALGAVTYGDIPAEVLAGIRRWHGTIDEQYNNICNVTDMLTAHQTDWSVPQELLQRLAGNRSELGDLIVKCRSNSGSPADRTLRNSLLKSTVGLCLTHVKSWAFTQCYAGVLTPDDVHLLGFFLPGDNSGRRDRREPTGTLAEVKVSVINMDNVRVVIDQSNVENAALVRHGWPQGVRQALIVILASDGVTEVYRRMTSRLHTDIEMPVGSRGKLFIIKAAFLRHVDDNPKFGPEPTFFMPLTTEDLAAITDRHHHEEFEEQVREVERHRLEMERLKPDEPAS